MQCLVNIILASHRERSEAASSLRQAREESMQLGVYKPPTPEGSQAGPLALTPQPSSISLADGIDDLIAALKPRRSTAEGGTSEDGSTPSGVAQVMCGCACACLLRQALPLLHASVLSSYKAHMTTSQVVRNTS